MARVSTYLNFPDHTEEAFNFYRSVFNTEFNAPGITRFGDMPPHDGAPPMSNELKKLVMHVELPITGGHVLMGTDAPAEMGFSISYGNNVYINLEPDSRTETKRLFTALALGGKVEMELQEMFWGDYFGSCKDKYGIQWMFNCSAKQ
jgi:PhnB protein